MRWARGNAVALAIVGAAVVSVLARLRWLDGVPTRDEAGFLMVGQQWDPGSSLYGDYWVDRPPFLIAIFQAAAAGDLVPLRLIGCVAAVLLVLGTAQAARQLGGPRAAAWAAVAASALCTTPWFGARAVNGELLAAPFVVGGIAAAIAAVEDPGRRRAFMFAAVAGAIAASAALIKQNMVDVFVFGLVVVLVALRRGEMSGREAFRVVLAAVSGALVAAALVGAWAIARGTSITAVVDAMYLFRLRATGVVASEASHHAMERFMVLGGVAVVSGLGLLMLAHAHHAVARRPHPAVLVGLFVTIAYGVVSVLLGGNYWTHYLIQLIGPVSIVTGLLAARAHAVVRPLVGYVAVVAACAWAIDLAIPPDRIGSHVGAAVSAAAEPGDTIVVAFGHPDVVRESGLRSPYPYLWGLPVKTRDADLAELRRVLESPTAPTWFVTWRKRGATPGVSSAAVEKIVARDYRIVTRVCGRTIHLRAGLDRPKPVAPAGCPSTALDIRPAGLLR